MTRAATLILIRHGQVEGEGRLHGHVDTPLSHVGREKMRGVCRALAADEVTAVYSSDLSRARESADIVFGGRGGAPVHMPEFRELHMGRWDGESMRTVMETDRELLENWWRDVENFRVPGGESLGDLRARVLPALMALISRHMGETISLVAHGGVNRVILFEALGMPLSRYYSLSQEYGCVNRLRYFEDKRSVVDLVNG